jgi:hypothetical protein
MQQTFENALIRLGPELPTIPIPGTHSCLGHRLANSCFLPVRFIKTTGECCTQAKWVPSSISKPPTCSSNLRAQSFSHTQSSGQKGPGPCCKLCAG